MKEAKDLPIRSGPDRGGAAAVRSGSAPGPGRGDSPANSGGPPAGDAGSSGYGAGTSSPASASPSAVVPPAYAGYYGADPMDEIDLLGLVKVVWRARWVIAATALIAAVIAFGFTYTKERMYESRGVFAIQTRTIAVGSDQSGSIHNTAVLTSILRSRQLAETVVDSLSLQEAWETPTRTAAVKRLQDGISVNANDRDGIITISFKSTDPVLARDIVANYVELFEEQANELNVTEADQVVTFVEERLEQVSSQLQRAEEQLLQFKERYGIVSLQQQTQSLVNAHAKLTEQIRSLSVELTGKRSYLTERDPEVQSLLSQIAELERQVRALERGNLGTDTRLSLGRFGVAAGLSESAIRLPASDRVEPPMGGDGSILLPATDVVDSTGVDQTLSFDFGLRDVPAITMELEALERDVAQHRQMYELLRQQYETARLDATRKMSIVRLIDPPEVPVEPLSRGLVLNVALAGVVGAFAALMFAFIAEFLRQRAQDDAAVQELPFLRYFRSRGPAA